MGVIGGFTPEKLIMGILTTVPDRTEELLGILNREFGPVDYLSPELDFNYTDYYVPEMGSPIRRIFASFENLADPESLADIKKKTISIELLFAVDGKRRVNLDPGMMSLDRFMLATTKDNGHRVPLKDGIYAEVTLLFVSKQFQPLPWTYADYRSSEYMKILSEIRKKYKEDLKRIRQR